MKTVSIREVQHHLSRVLKWVEQGEVVEITRRRKPVAKIVPLDTPGKPVSWPDFIARSRQIWGGDPKGGHLGDVVVEQRKDRL